MLPRYAGMRGRHWERLSAALGSRVAPSAEDPLNLQKLLSFKITDHAELLQVRLRCAISYQPLHSSFCCRSAYGKAIATGPFLPASLYSTPLLPTLAEPPQELSDTASREMALERSLDRMVHEWSGVRFETAPWKNTGARRVAAWVCELSVLSLWFVEWSARDCVF